MTRQKKFNMGTTRQPPASSSPTPEIERFVHAPSPPQSPPKEEPLDRVNFVLPRRLRIRFNQEAAARDMKKQDLAREIFEFYFENK